MSTVRHEDNATMIRAADVPAASQASVHSLFNAGSKRLAIEYAVSTVSRRRPYIHRLLPELIGGAPVRLVVGSPEREYLRRYAQDSSIEIVGTSPDEWARFKNCGVHHRATWNYWRTVVCCAQKSDRDGVLVFEDDVLPAAGWRRWLDETVCEVEKRFQSEYILSLYSAYDFPPMEEDGLYALYPNHRFFGTQAMYYPESVRARFAEYLRQHGVEENRAPYDLILKSFLRETGVYLFATIPSLVQHVGKLSTGLGFRHRAAYFQKYLRPGANPWKRASFLWRSLLRSAIRSFTRHQLARRRAKVAGMDFSNHSFDPDGVRRAACRIGNSTIRRWKREWQRHIQQVPPPSGLAPNSRGIVIFAGGVRYFTCAWISIQLLRRRGCTLPIELWHLDTEMTDGVRAELSKCNVECRNLRHVTKANIYHFSAKPFCILHSKFTQVLFLDSDNVCTRDPDYLFERPEFQSTGCTFWPDYWKTEDRNPIWKLIDCQYSEGREQDSGQVLIDKSKVWKALNLCCHFNLNWKFYYQFLMGDKDTFRFAWMALKRPFTIVPHEPAACGYIKGGTRFLGVTIAQHDFDGNILFLHRNSLKWDITYDDEFVWQEIRQFRQAATNRRYYLNNFGHVALEMYGDIEKKDFKDVFPELEQECMTVLMQLRASAWYQKFLVDYYIMLYRGE